MPNPIARIPAIPDIPKDIEPALYEVLDAMRTALIVSHGGLKVKDKRPTVQDLIDAGVTNAENIT